MALPNPRGSRPETWVLRDGGREIRVFVQPDKLDDLACQKLARDIATKIESTMQYLGTIKVNVVRESRAVEFAK